jgi:DNA primase
MRSLIESKLNTLGVKYKQTGEEFFLTQCLNPNHNDDKPSMYINFSTGFGECFACGYKVSPSYWNTGEEDNKEIIRLAKYKNLTKFFRTNTEKPEYQIILPPKDSEVPDGWRGLSKKIIDKYGLYICQTGKYANRVIFPFWQEGELLGFNSRALKSDMSPKYLYAKHTRIKDVIYPYFEKANEIILVEGVMDALSLVQDGFTAIANLGLSVNFSESKLKTLLKKGVTKIWLMFDNDEAGKKAYSNFFKSELKDIFELEFAFKHPLLKEYYKSGAKDYNEFLQKKVAQSQL